MNGVDIFNLSGKRAVVTGAAGGLGKSLARGLSEFGAELVLMDINAAEIQNLSEEMGAEGIVVDLSRRDSVRAAFDQAIAGPGKMDILINAAGVTSRSPALEIDEEELQRVMNINFNGLFWCCQAAALKMKDTGGGRIINVASIASSRALPGRSLYTASKGAVAQLTKVLAWEWACYGININAVAPAYLNTQMTRDLYRESPYFQWIKGKTALSRVLEPDEVTGAVVLLASAAGSGITGQILYVDGGWTAA